MAAPYVPFYTSDFLAGTAGMAPATRGVYITLLCLIYEEDGPITQNWPALARRCCCTFPAFKKALAELEQEGKIEIVDGAIWSEKCEKHIMQRRERQKSAKAAAKSRWQKKQQNQGSVDAGALPSHCEDALRPHCDDDANQNQSQNHSNTPPLSPPDAGEPTLFDAQDDPASQTEPPASRSAPKAEKRSRSASDRGSLLPPNWRLPKEWGDWAMAHGLSEFEARREAEKFRDYWTALSGAKARKKDWFATWRNWVRTAVERRGPQGTGYRRRNYGI